jgi:hypothetical protein
MKKNIVGNYRSNFLKTTVLMGITLSLVLSGSVSGTSHSKMISLPVFDAPTIFTIENPPVDFEVIDADPFDGVGDNGPYATFNDVLLGTLGECRSIAEFDISPFSVPPGEFISRATFEVIIHEINISGLGVNGETPESLAVDGYVGNGLEELSDFEAGDGNVLDSIATPDPQIGQVLSFNVTSFVVNLVHAQEQYVGLTVRAETFGGLWVTEGDSYPKLTIETRPEPQPDLHCDGSLSWTDIKPSSTIKGSFEVSNIGDNGSELSWQIESYPTWGTWSFSPSNGTALPKGIVLVENITVIAPSEKRTEFTGKVKIINAENPDDYEEINVYLKTPLKGHLWLPQFFERFPHAFPVLRQLLGCD